MNGVMQACPRCPNGRLLVVEDGDKGCIQCGHREYPYVDLSAELAMVDGKHKQRIAASKSRWAFKEGR